jgi:hypothetical protein
MTVDWFWLSGYTCVSVAWGCLAYQSIQTQSQARISAIVSGALLLLVPLNCFIGNLAGSTLTSSAYRFYEYRKQYTFQPVVCSVPV